MAPVTEIFSLHLNPVDEMGVPPFTGNLSYSFLNHIRTPLCNGFQRSTLANQHLGVTFDSSAGFTLPHGAIVKQGKVVLL
jgi:hypothetical protein